MIFLISRQTEAASSGITRGEVQRRGDGRRPNGRGGDGRGTEEEEKMEEKQKEVQKMGEESRVEGEMLGAPEWRCGLRHCISVLEESLQTLARFQAVSQLAVIENPIGRHTIGPASSGLGCHCK